MIESLPVLFMGARAGEKKTGAGLKRNGSRTLVVWEKEGCIIIALKSND